MKPQRNVEFSAMSFQFPEQPQSFSKTVLAKIFVLHVTEGNYSSAMIILPSWGHISSVGKGSDPRSKVEG